MQEGSLSILNGRTEEDWDKEFTFVGTRDCTVIDYVFVSDRIKDDVTAFRIENKVDLDHLPLILEIKLNISEEEERRRKRGTTMKNTRRMEIITKKMIRWDVEAIGEYKNNGEAIGWMAAGEGQSVDVIWEKLKDLVKSSLIYTKRKIKRWKIGLKDW